MLRSSNSRPITPSVKLFPRLATAKIAPNIRSHVRSARRQPRRHRRTRVRARLLQMILDNERARRNWRPSAS